MGWPEIVYLAAMCAALGALLLFVHVRYPRSQQTLAEAMQEHAASKQPPPIAPIDTAIQDTALQSISSRLAVVEGRIGAIAATLEGVHILQQRVASMETNMPAAQEAMEKYADSITRADKRDTERLRRFEKTSGQTAGDAAAALTADVEAPTTPLGPTAENNGGKRAGILGQGGRGR